MPLRSETGIPGVLSFHQATSYQLLPPATSTSTQPPAAVAVSRLPLPVSRNYTPSFANTLGGQPSHFAIGMLPM